MYNESNIQQGMNVGDQHLTTDVIRIGGFSIHTLDSMVYNNSPIDDLVNENDLNLSNTNIQCNYMLPRDLRQPNPNMTVMCHNIRSMNTNFDNFSAELLNNGVTYDIIGICETHLTDSTENLYPIKNLKIFTNNVTSNKGGVCIYANDKLSCKVRGDLTMKKEHIETLFLEVIMEHKPLIVGMLYRRPETSIECFMEDLSKILNNVRSKCIIMGDFNLNLLNELQNIHVTNLINKFKQCAFMRLILKPTRVHKNSATLLDHIWVNFNQSNFVSNVIFTDISDHFPVKFQLQTLIDREKKTITYRKSGEDLDNIFSENLRNFDFTHILESNDVNESFNLLNDALSNMYDQYYPLVTKIICTNDAKKAWLTAGIRKSIKTKNSLYKKFLKRPITYGNAYRQFRNRLTKVIKQSKNIYYQEKFKGSEGNIKSTWKNINNILGKSKCNQNQLFKINSRYTDDPRIISNEFNKYFANIASSFIDSLPPSDVSFESYMPPRFPTGIRWEPTSSDEIKRIVKQCKDVKAGPDGIPMSLIKKNIDILSPIISNLCNKSINEGTL